MIIAVDTCVLVDFQIGVVDSYTLFLKERLESWDAYFPPVVVAEFLSNPRFDKKTYQFFQDIPLLEISDGYWQRAGETRRILLEKGLKAKLGDSLIAQACIDNEVALLTRDLDFRHYEKHCGLKLVQEHKN